MADWDRINFHSHWTSRVLGKTLSPLVHSSVVYSWCPLVPLFKCAVVSTWLFLKSEPFCGRHSILSTPTVCKNKWSSLFVEGAKWRSAERWRDVVVRAFLESPLSSTSTLTTRTGSTTRYAVGLSASSLLGMLFSPFRMPLLRSHCPFWFWRSFASRQIMQKKEKFLFSQVMKGFQTEVCKEEDSEPRSFAVQEFRS